MVRKKLFSGILFFLTIFCSSNTNSMEMLLSTAVLQHLPWITAGSVYVATVSYYKVKDMLRSKQMADGFKKVNSRIDNLKGEVKEGFEQVNTKLNILDVNLASFQDETKGNFAEVLSKQDEHTQQFIRLFALATENKDLLELLKKSCEKNDFSNDFISSALENLTNQSAKNGQEIAAISNDLVKVKQLMQLHIGLTLEASPELKKKIHETFGDDLKLFFNSDKKQNEKNNKNTCKLSVANTNVQSLKNLLLPFSPNPEISVLHKFNFSGIKNNSNGGLKELLPN